MRIGTKSFLDCRLSRLVFGFVHPLRFRSTPPVCRLWGSITPSPSTPPCAPTVSGESSWKLLLWSFIYIYLRRSCDEKNRHEIQDFNYFFLSLMQGLGRHWGDISSSSWGKETMFNWLAVHFVNDSWPYPETNEEKASSLRRLSVWVRLRGTQVNRRGFHLIVEGTNRSEYTIWS